ncbi:hypothetical protein C0989_007223, partial [Termitomyces sp. Mn162]
IQFPPETDCCAPDRALSKAGEAVSSVYRAAPPHLTSTAPAVDSSSAALVDVMDSTPAESLPTELLSDKETKLTSDKVLEEIEDNPSTSTDTGETSVANIYATPHIDNENLQQNNNIRFDEPRRRAKIEITNQNERNTDDLTREQADTIKLARNNMTPSQRELIDTCNRNLSTATAQAVADSGPSSEKGKGPDPRNWGDADLLREDLDHEVQCHILEECNAHWDELNTADDEAAGTEDLDSEENDSEEEVENCLTHEELRERIQLKPKLEEEICQMKRELKSKKSKRSKRAGSQPISNELQDMINKVTHRARSSGRMDAKEDSSMKLRPVNQVTRDSALGRAFDRIQKEEGSDPSESESLNSSESSHSSSSDAQDSTYPSSGSDESYWSTDSSTREQGKTRRSIGGDLQRKGIRESLDH